MYARISSTRGELGPILRFAGGPEAEWPCGLFRTLRYELLPMLATPEASTLRQVCKELKREVEAHPWEDMATVIRGYVGARVGVSASAVATATASPRLHASMKASAMGPVGAGPSTGRGRRTRLASVGSRTAVLDAALSGGRASCVDEPP